MCSIFSIYIIYECYSSITLVNSQSGEGLEITPSVQWSENLEGTFSYCVYEGTVTLDSVNDPQAFCIVPTSDSSFENMQSLVDDGIDTYEMEPIQTPAGLFKDGAPSLSALCFPRSHLKKLDLIQQKVVNNSQTKKEIIQKNRSSTLTTDYSLQIINDLLIYTTVFYIIFKYIINFDYSCHQLK